MKYFVLFFLVFALAASIAQADPIRERTREYRPLEAKKVVLRTGARVERVSNPSRAEDFKRLGWSHFDRREWAEASEAFLTALEMDPSSVEVAEALGMSLYKSGRYRSAYEFGRKLQESMPTVHRMISETTLADVRYMISRGEFAAADEFLSHFPERDPSYEVAHTALLDAATLTAATAPHGDRSIDPATAKEQGRSFVRN